MTRAGRSNGMPTCMDAVVVVPGIMGSELIDRDGHVRWGLKASVLGKAWLNGQLDVLRVTDDDLAGKGRLRPGRLLRTPGYIPDLFGLEPYTALLRRLSTTAVDARAVAEFAYDWRLSIEFNATKLVKHCDAHLDAWRKVVSAERYCDPQDARLVIVAHSMGGLVSRAAAAAPGMTDILRDIITLGTPYFGAMKAVRLLETGEGAPVPKRAARMLAKTCPGVYDLLPRYRCVRDDDHPQGLRHLSSGDVASIGGDCQLAEDAAGRWARLELIANGPGSSASATKAVVGAGQPTLQSVSIVAGACLYLGSLKGIDHGGDSTVYRQAAAPLGVTAFPLPQKHGALAKTEEALGFVVDKLTGGDTGLPLGTHPLGADIPDVIERGASVSIRVTCADGLPPGISVMSEDLSTGRPTRWSEATRDDDALLFFRNELGPGLHRIEVKGGGFSAVSDIALVTDKQ
jgi:hypothetical protein